MNGSPALGSPSARVLLVEDNASLRRGIARALAESVSSVDEEERGDLAIARIADPARPAYDLVVTDLRLPGADGLAVLDAARRRDPGTAAIVMTAFGNIDTAVEAMRRGAFDFLEKPFELGELEVRVGRALEHASLLGEVASLRQERRERLAPKGIIGRSPALRRALELSTRVAPTRSTVLITGETGTGKELVAGLIHAASPRADAPFVKMNCAALPETLLESELFGHERGAFTSADRVRIGRFEQADGGTLFLDEVGDMSLATQAKLLRVLQDQQFQRLGGTKLLHTDVRIVAATNRDLEEAIGAGDFREDLFFRLNVISIALPPLRERPEDVEVLAHHFLDEFSRELSRSRTGFSRAALAQLRGHSWPGNVRELRNVIERAVLLAEGPQIEADDVVLGGGGRTGPGWRPGLPSEGLAWEEIERALVLEALERTGFVQKDAAALLRVSRRKLNYMVQRMGITHASWRRHRMDES
jgi:DNA-binding NtrC family response regulator